MVCDPIAMLTISGLWIPIELINFVVNFKLYYFKLCSITFKLYYLYKSNLHLFWYRIILDYIIWSQYIIVRIMKSKNPPIPHKSNTMINTPFLTRKFEKSQNPLKLLNVSQFAIFISQHDMMVDVYVHCHMVWHVMPRHTG